MIPNRPHVDRIFEYFKGIFSSNDVESIATEIIRLGDRYESYELACRIACERLMKRGVAYNFLVGKWLGSGTRTYQNLKRTVIEVSHDYFKGIFSSTDVKSIAKEIIRLGDRCGRYELACKKFMKRGITYNFLFGKWLGSTTRTYENLKRTVSRAKEKSERIRDKLKIGENENLRLQLVEKENMLSDLNSTHVKCKKQMRKFRNKANSTQNELDEKNQVINIAYFHLHLYIHTQIEHTLIPNGDR